MKLRNLFYVVMLFLLAITNIDAQEWTKNLPQKDPSELTFFDYQNAFYQYCDELGVDEGYYFDEYGEKHKMAGWKQFKRWEWFWEQLIDPKTGKFPNFSAEDMVRKYYNPPQQLPNGLATATWTSLGPISSGGGYAGLGRINCIAFHPTDNNTFWVGTPAGGIWKTTNGGSSWTVLNNGTGVLGVSDIVIPSDYAASHTIYIATGDRDATDNRSIGVLKSTDGGVTWNTTALNYNLSQNQLVTRLLLDPNDDNTLIAVTKDGVFRTTDGGTTWPMISNPAYYFIDMEYKPGDFNTLYGATRSSGDIWRSTDGGVNWTRVLNSAGSRVELAVSPANASVVYALVGAPDNSLFGVYKSTNSGASFSLVYDGSLANHNLLGYYTDQSGSGGQAFYDLSLEVSNTDANTVFVGGVITFKSTDGGTTFNAISCWTASNTYNSAGVPVVHADKHKLQYRSNGDLFECNDGGVYISNDNGSTWTDKTNGMVISQMYRLGVSQTVATETQCGLQDNGTKLITGGVWSDVRGGDGMECIIDYTDVNVQYNTYTNGKIDRTDNHWMNSHSIKPTGSDGAWVTPYVLDPVDHNTVYAGYQHIYKSTDKGENWSIIYNLDSGDKFRALAVAPSNTQYIYASEPYTLWKTTDGGTNWTDITTGLPGGFITYIAIKNDDPNTVWVTLSTYTGNSVYQTTDGGSNWTNISTGLPAVPVNTIVQDKLVTDQVDLYAGTYNGVYYKAGAANWAPFNGGLPNVDVRELEIYYAPNPSDSKLRAASYGRGLWETPIIAPCSVTITQSDEGDCNDNGTGSNAADDWFDITFNATAVSSVSTQYQVVLNANADGTGGTVLGTSDYGTAITVGTSSNPPFVADGATTYNITIRDATNNTCHADYTTTPVASCSNAIADCSQLFISQYGEPSSGNGKYIEIYNPTNATVDLSNYKIWKISNGGNWPEATINLNGESIAAYDVFVIANNSMDVPGADKYSGSISFNGDDAMGLAYNGGSGSTFSLIDAIGEDGPDPGNGWDVAGITNATKNHTLVRKSTVKVPNTDWDASRGTNTSDSEWEVQTYNQNDLGSHTSDCYTPPVCSLTDAGLDNVNCNNNGTGNNSSDDYITFTLDPQGQNTGTTYNVTVPSGYTVTPTSGTYGASTPTLFQLNNGSAGGGDVTVTITDADDSDCTLDVTVTDPGSCSVTIYIDNHGGPTIADPCTCAGDGLFDEEVVVHSNPGETWTVSANTGYLDPNTLVEFTVGTTLTEISPGVYSLVGKHRDDIGYDLTVQGGPAGVTPIILSINNLCWYPDPSITGLDNQYCENDPAVTLTGSAQLGDGSGPAPEESHDFSINGVGGATQFDPAALGAGSYQVIYTFDAEDDDPDEHHPGCVAYDTMDVVVNALPNVVAASNSPICEGEDILLQETGGEADTWSWTGPNGFTSTDQNPVISDATVAASGTYTVVGTNSTTGCENETTVDVVVNPKPDEPVVDDITVCEGESTLIVPQQTGGGGGTPTCGLTGDVSITGIMDGPLTGGVPKFVELYVHNTTDFTGWSVRNHNNGGAGVSNETDLSSLGTINAGEYVYVIRWGNNGANEQAFLDWFGLTQAEYDAMNTIAGPAPNVNGDDAVTLFDGTNIIDQYGVVGVDGTGQTWEYKDGWAYRNNETGPDGTNFDDTEWTYSGPDALDGETSNATAQTPFPIGTYTCSTVTGDALFNFYTDAALTNLVAGPATSYDPGTTPANSPQSIWVTQIDTTSGCESDAVEVVVTVYEQPSADAGDNQFFCDLPASIQLNATANYDGQWTTTGAGTIAYATNTSTTYSPVAADLGTTVIMTWTTGSPAGATCEAAVDSMGVTFVPPTEDAEFSYTQDEYCPEDGNPTVTHTTGVDGIYTWEAIDPNNNLVIDKHTGEIDMNASDWGIYDITNTVDGRGNLIITGVIDGPITGGLPKAIELYVVKDITDLSRYGLESANNGNGSAGTPEYTFPDDAVAAGTYIWVATEALQFNNFFGEDPTYTNGVASINGDDAIVLYNDGQVIDVFGDVNTDGTGQPWEYKDGWAYRNNNTGPDGTLFDLDNWSFSGPDALDGETSNATAQTPFPMGSFTTTFSASCDANTHTERITVGDIEPPTVNCPADQTVYLDPGDCGVFLWYDDPDVIDNCSGDPVITKIAGPDKGSEFTLLGSPYTIEFEVYDANGNGPVNCSFDIAIEGYPNPLDGVMACNDVVKVSLDSNCVVQMNADNFLEGGPYHCYNMFQVYVDDPAYSGVNVTNEKIHLDPGTYMVTVADAANGNNSCMTTMIVQDKLEPTLECNCPAGGLFPEGSEWSEPINGKFFWNDKMFDIHNNCYNFGSEEFLPGHDFHYYDVYPVQVSADGDYSLIMTDDNSKAILGVYEDNFNSAEVCNNLIWGDGGYYNFFGSFYVEPNTTVTLEAGKQYYIVVSDFDSGFKGKYTLEMIPPTGAQIYFTQSIYDDKCVLYGCYNPKKDYSDKFEIPEVIDNCDIANPVLISSEFVDSDNCGIQKLVNTWQTTDLGGNVATCTQEYVFQGLTLGKLEWPKNYDNLPFNNPMLECDGLYPLDENGNPSPYNKGGLEGTGKPKGFGNTCAAEIFYYDEVHPLDCGTKILRHWTLVDDCTGAVYTHTQIIRITDTTAPTFMVPDNIEAKTKAYICNSNIEVPAIMHLEDNCCTDLKWWVTTDMGFDISGDINGNGYVDANETWTLLNVPTGTYELCYHAVDCCDNQTDQCITIHVFDGNPPIAVCEQYKQVSLTAMGNARVYALDFDSGSFDNCNPVYFKVLRVGDDQNYDGGCENLNGDDRPATATIDVWYDDEVSYCCEDAQSEVMTSLRVFDVDPGAGPVYPSRMEPGGDLYGHYNDCWSIVKVECKIPPALDCPPVSISCEESLDPNENPKLWPNVISVCGYELDYSDNRDMGICGANIVRTWTATGCGKATQCKQKISIETTEPFDPCTIKFPRDVKADCSKELRDGGEPKWDENPCNIVTAEIINEDTFKFVDGACYKIVRDWAVIDWCVYEPNSGAEDNIDAISGTKLNCSQLVEDGYYRYTQILMVTDFIPPTIEVEDDCIGYTDGCFANGATLNAHATDSCNFEQKFNWKYLVLNMDTWDTIQYSYNYTPRPQSGRKGSRSKDNLDRTSDASLVILDALPGGTYKVEWTVGDGCGNANTTDQYFRVVDKKAPTPVMVDIATAMMTNCSVEVCANWFDKGGCDGSCISSYDNCTDKEDLYFTFSAVLPKLDINPWKWQKQLNKYGRYFYDPVTGLISTEEKYLFGEAFAWDPEKKTSCRIYGIDREGNAPELVIAVDIYVWDQFAENEDCDDNNYDFATAILTLNNEGDDCPSVGSLVSGMVSQCNNDKPVSDVKITFDNGEQFINILNSSDGIYKANLIDDNYSVVASKQEDGIYGLTTLDLVIIQKHLLGIKKVNDVCRYASMDVNGDGKVSAADILNARRLILGVLPAEMDWRFLDEDYVINNTDLNHFSLKDAYRKTISVFEGNTLDNTNFTGVRSGDVNLSGYGLESRNGEIVNLQIDNIELTEDNDYEIPVYGNEFENIFGAQFTMGIKGLDILSIKPGILNINSNNYNIVNDNLVLSWNNALAAGSNDNDPLFTLIVKSNINGDLINVLNINDNIAKSEVYSGEDLEISDLKLEFRNADMNYTLYQNEPNPFSEATKIGFTLPEDSQFNLTVFDLSGRIVKEFNLEGKAGYNTLKISKKDIGLSGVYYYRLESGNFTDTKKMIILK